MLTCSFYPQQTQLTGRAPSGRFPIFASRKPSEKQCIKHTILLSVQPAVHCKHSSPRAQAMQDSNCNTANHNISKFPFLCGLTGSIGMGKSTVSSFFTQQGVPVLCADDVVHKLYSVNGAAVAPVGAAFPAAIVDGAVDRAALSKCVVGNNAAMKLLEGIVHPLVEQERIQFVRKHASLCTPLLLFDIPLLYETRAESGLDAVVVVSAPSEVQRERVMARLGMTAEKFEAILARQVPDAEKRKRADYVINTGCSLQETEQQVVQLIEQLKDKQGQAAEKLLAEHSSSHSRECP